jgi:hypothetical protein
VRYSPTRRDGRRAPNTPALKVTGYPKIVTTSPRYARPSEKSAVMARIGSGHPLLKTVVVMSKVVFAAVAPVSSLDRDLKRDTEGDR